ncbi:MAG: hypothetical protein ACMUIL_05835 [bacterium]
MVKKGNMGRSRTHTPWPGMLKTTREGYSALLGGHFQVERGVMENSAEVFQPPCLSLH